MTSYCVCVCVLFIFFFGVFLELVYSVSCPDLLILLRVDSNIDRIRMR